MPFLMKFFDKLAEAETAESMTSFQKLYGPLMQISWLVPTFQRSQLPLTLTLFVVYFVLIFGHFSLLMATIWIELNTFEQASLAMHYGLIILFCIVLLVSINSNRSLMFENSETMGATWGYYHSNNIYGEEEVKRFKQVIDSQLLKFLWMPGSVTIGAGATLLVPYAMHYGEGRFTENGINLDLPLQIYYPFPTHEGINHFVVVGLQMLTVTAMALIIITILLSFLRLGQRVRFEFRVASYALETLLERATRVYKRNHPDRDPSRINTSDPVYQDCIGICLRDIVIHHHTIIDLSGRFDLVACWPTAFAMSIGTGSIGLSLVNILWALGANNYEYLAIFFVLLVSEVLNLLVLCVIGEAITSEAMKFRDHLYFADWHKLNVPNRKILLNLQVGANEPLIMKAGGIVDVNHDTFSSIINSAYSFFNIMNVGLEA